MTNQIKDIVIIGGGAGAFASAIVADKQGANTVMINDGLPLGGTCVNVGCVPSKKLIWAGEVLHLAKTHAIPGIDIEVKHVDFSKIIEDELALVDRMRREKYEKVLKSLKNVTLIEGKARFISSREVFVKNTTIKAEKIIIATGSTARIPEIDGLRKTGYITHIEALKLKKLPKRLVIIGGGVQSLEFAQMFARFGSQITILYRSEKLFKQGERQIVDRLVEILQSEGIKIITNVQIQSVEKNGVNKLISYHANGGKEQFETDEILLAVGKVPNTVSLNLEKANIEIDMSGAINVSKTYQTTSPNVYAVGDVINMPLRLETTAGREGTLATENALTGSNKTIDYGSVPYTIFTDPQLAGVGMTEKDQMRQMKVCACRFVSFDKVPKAIIMGRTEGMIGMAIHPETHVVQGVHVLAPNAGELIAEAMILIKSKYTIEQIIKTLPMFPTLSESIKLVARSFTTDISKLSCCV